MGEVILLSDHEKEIERLTADLYSAVSVVQNVSRDRRRLIAKVERLEGVEAAAGDLCNWVQKELQQGDAWQQYDFLQVPFDLFWFYQLRKALAEKDT